MGARFATVRTLGFCAVLFALGCTREVAAGLDEAEANRAVVSLARAGVDAEKVADSQNEGHFKLVVSRDDATLAISVLAGEELPRAKPAAPKDPGLVSSPEADRAARILATSAQIERSLSSIEGVLDARVHLDVPTVDPLLAAVAGTTSSSKATASVLVRHRGNNPPILADDIRKLVSGGVSGLAPADVAVVLVAVPAPSLAGDRELAHVGPIAVSRGSLGALRATFGVLLLAVAVLAGLILVLASRLRRLKEAKEEEAPREAARPRGA